MKIEISEKWNKVATFFDQLRIVFEAAIAWIFAWTWPNVLSYNSDSQRGAYAPQGVKLIFKG